MPIPHEFAIGEVYMPPLLVAAFLGLIAAFVTAHLLNRYRLTRYFFYPPLVFVALTIIYTIFPGAWRPAAPHGRAACGSLAGGKG